MKKKGFKNTVLLLLACFTFTVVFDNPVIVEAATKMLSNFSKVTLTKAQVGDDIYLQDIYTLDNGKTMLGVFASPSQYEYYYGTSTDMKKWDLTANYFSLVKGNDAFVGISTVNYKNSLSYTKDGITWKSAKLPNGIDPMAVKFENGYFKLTAEDQDGKPHLYFSKDAITWYDIAKELPVGAKVDNVIVKDNKIYSIVGGNSVKLYSTTKVDESATKWAEAKGPKKDGFGLSSEFMFDGKTVGITLYSIDEYNKNGYVTDKLYYMSNDFVNWEEKDWTGGSSLDFYSVYDSTSTEKVDLQLSNKRFDAVEVLPYEDSNAETYYVSYVVYSEDEKTWKKQPVEIYVDGVKVSKTPKAKSDIQGIAKHEWAREAAEYAVGRNFVMTYDGIWQEKMSKGQYLTLIMKALDVKEPTKAREGYKAFEDVWGDKYIERANKLGLVSAKSGNLLGKDDMITYQAAVDMTYDIMKKLNKVPTDGSVKKEAVVKSDKLSGKATDALTYLEAVSIAKNISSYKTK